MMLIPSDKYERLMNKCNESDLIAREGIQHSQEICSDKQIVKDICKDEVLVKCEDVKLVKQTERSLDKDIILLFMPLIFKTRAKALLTLDCIQWDNNGRLLYQGEYITGSQITDLIKACLHEYKDYDRFVGMEQFCKLLAENNVPLTMIANLKLRRILDRMKGTQVPKSTMNTWISI